MSKKNNSDCFHVMLALREHSEGKHLCAYCENFPENSTHEYDTTQDPHACSFFPHNDKHFEGESNNRVYPDGITTFDNGGGFWVVYCPYFRRMSDIFAENKKNEKAPITMLQDSRHKCKICGSGNGVSVYQIFCKRGVANDGIVAMCDECHRKLFANEEEPMQTNNSKFILEDIDDEELDEEKCYQRPHG